MCKQAIAFKKSASFWGFSGVKKGRMVSNTSYLFKKIKQNSIK
ncbi:hypothetical protein HPHPH21_0054 [Helicobacter pylori Hp H-21]|nr:hypothetical protein HPHPH21_0054 [Helicobacter pylori Hp H-21]